MPDITTSANFSYSAGSIRSTRLNAARFRFSPSTSLLSSSDTATTTAAEIPKLATLQRQVSYFDEGGRPTVQMQLHYQRMIEAIVDAFEAVNARVDEVAILARLSAVEQKAEVANDNAVAAKTEAAVVREATRTTFAASDPVLQDAYDEELDRLQNDGVIP